MSPKAQQKPHEKPGVHRVLPEKKAQDLGPLTRPRDSFVCLDIHNIAFIIFNIGSYIPDVLEGLSPSTLKCHRGETRAEDYSLECVINYTPLLV